MARLILATAEGQQAIELRPINSLGRHPNNSIQLLDKIVSKEHCILEQRDGGFILRDLGSLNGTYINGERVRGEQPLRHGDEIALGSTRARYDDGHGPPIDFNAPPPFAHGGPGPMGGVGPGAVAHPHHAPNANPGQQPQPGMQQQPWSKGPSVPPPVPASMGMGMPSGPAPSHGHPGMAHGPGGTIGMPAAQSQPRPGMNQGGYPGQPNFPPQGQPGNFGPPPLPRAGQRPPSFGGTRVDVLDSARAIGTQIDAQTKGFVPFDQIAARPAAAARRLRAPAPHVGALARHRSRARPRSAAPQDPDVALQVRERGPRRHPPPRRGRQAPAARRPPSRRHRRADPGLVDDPRITS